MLKFPGSYQDAVLDVLKNWGKITLACMLVSSTVLLITPVEAKSDKHDRLEWQNSRNWDDDGHLSQLSTAQRQQFRAWVRNHQNNMSWQEQETWRRALKNWNTNSRYSNSSLSYEAQVFNKLPPGIQRKVLRGGKIPNGLLRQVNNGSYIYNGNNNGLFRSSITPLPNNLQGAILNQILNSGYYNNAGNYYNPSNLGVGVLAGQPVLYNSVTGAILNVLSNLPL